MRSFWETHNEALGHAATLIAGQRGARLVERSARRWPNPGPPRAACVGIFSNSGTCCFLEHLQDEPLEETTLFDRLSPNDPIVPEICLLADGLKAVLQEADLRGVADLHLA